MSEFKQNLNQQEIKTEKKTEMEKERKTYLDLPAAAAQLGSPVEARPSPNRTSQHSPPAAQLTSSSKYPGEDRPHPFLRAWWPARRRGRLHLVAVDLSSSESMTRRASSPISTLVDELSPFPLVPLQFHPCRDPGSASLSYRRRARPPRAKSCTPP
jgi:hypothetical protein